MENRIETLLVSLGICDPSSIVEFYPRVRDRDDVKVMRCTKSGVVFLSRSDHVSLSHYKTQEDFGYWSSQSRRQALLDCYDDDLRRANQFESLIRNKKWLEMGTGVGGLLELLSTKAAETCAVEPQSVVREELVRCGYKVYSDIGESEDEHFDVITLFHVFEHLVDPLESLRVIAQKLARGGRLVVEVPHANDFLVTFLNLEAFKAATFWSEHLILHTRQSLETFLREAGFVDISVTGYQRYPLANHLHWLARGKPGGHKEWSFLVNAELDNAYRNLLAQLDKTDTLIAIARK
jgi:SAM-dependent methyltransferase